MDDNRNLKSQMSNVKSDEQSDDQQNDPVIPNASEKSPDSKSTDSSPRQGGVQNDITETTDEPTTEVAKSESVEVTPPVIASPEGARHHEVGSTLGVKQSPDNNPIEIASEPMAPRNDKSHPNAKWYVVHTYSGHENKVAVTLKQRIESEHLEGQILDVLVPMQDKIEIKGGKKVNIKEKIFPGYILVKMVLDDASWLAVRTTQGVTSFVGMGNKPTPISDAEVATIIKFTQEEAPVYKQVFAQSDTVKIVDGPFAEFIGKVDNVDEERGKVKVLVSIFGRETPVELDFLQVQKI